MSDSYGKLGERRLRAQLVCRMPPSPGVIEFDFNPEAVRIRRSAEFRSFGMSTVDSTKPVGSTPLYFKKADAPLIYMDNIIFEGPDTKAKCDQLLNWLTPGGGMLDMIGTAAVPMAMKKFGPSKGAGQRIGGLVTGKPFKDYTSKLPLLTFNWGPPVAGFWYDVHLKMANITFVRFSPVGIPVRAKVSLEMQEIPNMAATLPTNPTSGGLPGRSGYAVSEQETLPGIALANYGRPGAWRRLAEVNDIEDPLRMRPGDVLYLPNSDELHEESAS